MSARPSLFRSTLDGFSDPPALDITPSGALASFSLSLPSLTLGIFSLENISFGAGFLIPFDQRSMLVSFNFCQRHEPFLLTVSALGGGGFFLIEVDAAGVQRLEAALEFGASLSMNFGVASGGVHVMAGIYFAYETELDAASALDFDDLLLRAVVLLREDESVRERYQDRFLHLFVDEYQDTNRAQYELVKILAARHRNLTVVGDDDQSVFAFRGADVRNILSFQHDFPDATRVTLEQNYRSTQPILDIAHAVIRNNTERAEKRLWTERTVGDPVRLISVYDEREEALAVGAEIESLIGREGVSLSECAVLYRTNSQSRLVEEALRRYGSSPRPCLWRSCLRNCWPRRGCRS